MSGNIARVWTLDIIHSRCADDGDCWIWTQSVNGGGHPQASIEGKGGQLVRRRAFRLFRGRDPRMLQSVCRNPLCCNPEHLFESTHSAVLKEAYASGSRPRSKTSQWKGVIINAEKAAEIRVSAKPYRVLAAEYGLSESSIKGIRGGRTWRAAQNSVFGWRP